MVIGNRKRKQRDKTCQRQIYVFGTLSICLWDVRFGSTFRPLCSLSPLDGAILRLFLALSLTQPRLFYRRSGKYFYYSWEKFDFEVVLKIRYFWQIFYFHFLIIRIDWCIGKIPYKIYYWKLIKGRSLRQTFLLSLQIKKPLEMEFGIASFMHFSDGKKHCFYKSCKHMHRQSRIKQIIWKYEQIFEHVWKLNLKIANCFPLDVCCLVEFANFLSRPSQIMISISKTSHRGLYTWYQFCIVVLTLLTKAGGIGHPLRFTKPDIPLLQFVLLVRQAQVLF